MAIEVSHAQRKKSVTKKNRKPKRLAWSLNYKGSTSHDKGKG